MDDQRERWHDAETLDIAREMNRLTLAIVGKTLFGTETEAEAEPVRQALSESMKGFNRSMLPAFFSGTPAFPAATGTK